MGKRTVVATLEGALAIALHDDGVFGSDWKLQRRLLEVATPVGFWGLLSIGMRGRGGVHSRQTVGDEAEHVDATPSGLPWGYV